MVRQGFALGALLILFALLGAAHAAVHAGHVLRLVGHWTLGHARGGARHGIHGFDSADVFVGFVLIKVARQLHDLIAQLGYGDLVLAVAYEDLVDGNAAGDLVYALLKLVEGRAHAVLIALAHEDDAGVADDAVDKILLAGGGHTLSLIHI